MSAHDAPADMGDVLGEAEWNGLVDAFCDLIYRGKQLSPLHANALVEIAQPVLSEILAARDAAQRAERDAEWRARIPDITALKCAEARADEREQIAQAIEAERDSHFSNTVRACYDRAAAIARAGTAGGSDA